MPPKPTSLPSQSSRLHLRVGRRRQRDLLRVDAVEDRVARPSRAASSTACRARSSSAFDRLYIIRPSQVSGLYLNASRTKQPPRMLRFGIGDEQLRVRQLVDAEAAAGPAGALRIVEHEVLGPDVAVDEVVRRAAQRLVEPLGLGLARALDDVDLQQPVADEQRRGDPGLDRLLVLAADDEAGRRRRPCRWTFDSSSSTCSEMSTGLPSTISRRQPFLRTSVKTKSSSSP